MYISHEKKDREDYRIDIHISTHNPELKIRIGKHWLWLSARDPNIFRQLLGKQKTITKSIKKKLGIFEETTTKWKE